MCVWLNSTPGVLAQIVNSNPRVLSRPNMPLDGQRRIPVPFLPEGELQHLAFVFDQQKNDVQDRLRVADSHPRKVLDNAVASVLGVTSTVFDVARRELAREPAITGKRYES